MSSMKQQQQKKWFHPKRQNMKQTSHCVWGSIPSPLESELSGTGCEILLSLFGGGLSLSSLPLFREVVSGQSWLIRILQPASHSSWFRGGHIIQASPVEFFPGTFAKAFEESAFSPSSQAIKMMLSWSQQWPSHCLVQSDSEREVRYKQNGDSDQVQGCYINP